MDIIREFKKHGSNVRSKKMLLSLFLCLLMIGSAILLPVFFEVYQETGFRYYAFAVILCLGAVGFLSCFESEDKAGYLFWLIPLIYVISFFLTGMTEQPVVKPFWCFGGYFLLTVYEKKFGMVMNLYLFFLAVNVSPDVGPESIVMQLVLLVLFGIFLPMVKKLGDIINLLISAAACLIAIRLLFFVFDRQNILNTDIFQLGVISIGAVIISYLFKGLLITEDDSELIQSNTFRLLEQIAEDTKDPIVPLKNTAKKGKNTHRSNGNTAGKTTALSEQLKTTEPILVNTNEIQKEPESTVIDNNEVEVPERKEILPEAPHISSPVDLSEPLTTEPQETSDKEPFDIRGLVTDFYKQIETNLLQIELVKESTTDGKSVGMYEDEEEIGAAENILMQKFSTEQLEKLLSIIAEDAPLLLELNKKFPETAVHCNRVARLGYVASTKMTGICSELVYAGGLYHEIGRLIGGKEVDNTVLVADDAGFPEPLLDVLSEHSYKEKLPTTKEAAVVMLVDNICETVEYLKRSSNAKVLISKVIDKAFTLRMNKGDLDGSGLSVKELSELRNILVETIKEDQF